MSSQRHYLPNNFEMPSYGMQPQGNAMPMTPSYSPNVNYDMVFSGQPNQQASSTQIQRGELPIGRPMYLSSGPLAGRTVRMELHEIQKAELGRRYGKIDRRPIDPPPVILLKMFEVRHAGTNRQQEREMEYDTPLTIGLICTVDLFPVPKPGDLPIPQLLGNPAPPGGPLEFYPPTFPPSSSSSVQIPRYTHEERSQSGYASHYNSGYYTNPEVSSSDNEAIHYVNGYGISEGTKQTQALAGNTFVQPIVAEYCGRNAILFVFNDLSVKLEGYFILRYRVFDIYSQEHAGDTSSRSVMAECYGGIFRMYPSKTFPGLPPSTELTKHLALYNGTRVNVRNEERHRKL